MHRVFEGAATFSASDEAERWCEVNGISVGQTQRSFPRGLMFGCYRISKWRGMSAAEKKALHGKLEGNMREGPVKMFIKLEYEHLLPPAAENEVVARTSTASAGVGAHGCNAKGMTE